MLDILIVVLEKIINPLCTGILDHGAQRAKQAGLSSSTVQAKTVRLQTRSEPGMNKKSIDASMLKFDLTFII